MIHSSGLLAQPHPFLPGDYVVYVWLGLALELLAFATLAFVGGRAFLTVCLWLAVLFIAYHTLEVYLQIAAPCPCLGGLLSNWKPLTVAESTISFLLACGLGISAFIGLFPVSQPTSATSLQQPAVMAVVAAMAAWMTAGFTVVWFWKDRLIGGDEGMEGAKSLQLLVHPENVNHMWNDQPPLFTWLGTEIFRLFGASLTMGRFFVVFLGLCLPLTLGIYWARAGMRWVAVIAVIFLWLILPFDFSSFMLEAPAYCVGLAALLPLVLRGHGRWPLVISALIAALALSLKLTAAFALVAPFVWLLQRDGRRALLWGCLTVALTVLGSLIQPGWSWSSMSASHLDFGVKEIYAYRFDSLAYAQGWLVCALAVFAVANRYVRSELALIVPWLSATLAALFIHLIHRPFWDYYNIHLITPVAVLAGVGMIDLWRLLGRAKIPRLQQRLAGVFVMAVCCLWAWQRETELVASHAQAKLISTSPVVKELKVLGESGHTEFSIYPLWTFAAGQTQTPPELTIIPRKRVWSGQISDAVIVQMLASNHIDAIVLYQTKMKDPVWTNLLTSYVPEARDEGNILFVRKELNPKPISLNDEQTDMLHKLGL